MITSHKGAVALYYLGEGRLLSGEDFLNVVELVEGFDGGEVVHVDAQELIADLFEYRVVKLEEAKLDVLFPFRRCELFHSWVFAVARIVSFQIRQDLFGAFHDVSRHSRDASHVDTERVFRTTAHQFAQKNDSIVHFLHTDIPILYAGEKFLHLVELMIVRGEERASVAARVFV